MKPSSMHHGLIGFAALAFLVALSAPHVSGQGVKEPDTAILKGAPMGGVKFEHKLHAKDRQVTCQTCHHPSKPAKPAKSANQKCTDCHTKTATAPMKVNTRDAFHDAMAKKGLCIDCHATQNAKGKKAPTKCLDCHKKENA